MGKREITEETFFRLMPPSAHFFLKNSLDPHRLWEKLAVSIPENLDYEDENDFVPRYNYLQIQTFSEIGNKIHGSPTKAILDDWGTQNAKIKDLIRALVMSELYAAADYIAVKVLKGSPVPRNIASNNLDITNDENKSPGMNNTPHVPHENIDLPTPKLMKDKVISHTEIPDSTSFPRSSSIQDSMIHDSHIDSTSDESSNAGSVGRLVEAIQMDFNPDASVERTVKYQHKLAYNLLKDITDNFNDNEYSKGGHLLGKGGFSQVFLGKFQSGFRVAIKCLKEEVKDVDMDSQFETELFTLSEYRHENIVQLLGYSTDGPCKCLVYQYMTNGSLEDRLQCKNNSSPLTSIQRINIAKGSAEGIAYLNSKDLVHRDIKSANVLLDAHLVPKIADFATTRRAPQGTGVSQVQETYCVIGTNAYLAPEAHQYDVSTKLDSFSYGVVLLELLTGLPVYDQERENRDLKSHIEDTCDDIIDIIDPTAEPWDKDKVKVLYDVATRCLIHIKRRRALICDVLDDLRKL